MKPSATPVHQARFPLTMPLSTVALAALLLITLVVAGGLARSFFRGQQEEARALRQLADRITEQMASSVEADVTPWGRGFAVVEGGVASLAFRPDVFTVGELRSGVVDVWRVRMPTQGLPGKTAIVLTNQPGLTGDRVVDDVEGRPFERVGWRSSDDAIAAGVLGPGALSGALRTVLGRWRVRGLSIAADGTLEVSAERDTATLRELESLIEDVRGIAASVASTVGRALPAREDDEAPLVSLGPASGEPVPVASRHRTER